MWYSVTPEAIANHIADRMTKMILAAKKKMQNADATSGEVMTAEHRSYDACNSNPKRALIILDAFCGCGGNSIAFARWNERVNSLNEIDGGQKQHEHNQCPDDDKAVTNACHHPRVKVIAVENNLTRLKMAAHNASVYNVPREDIVFIHADAIEVLKHYSQGKSVRCATRNSDGGGGGDNQLGSETSYAGFALGGMDLLPNYIDGIFLSPPWGGMDYATTVGKAGFDPVTSITVESSGSSVNEAPLEDEDEVVVEGAASCTTTVTTNGGELLRIASKSVFGDTHQEAGVVAYFLPRNIDGIALGKIAVASDIRGCYEMEQNVVNGKVKTVTAYFGPGCASFVQEDLSNR